MRRLHAQAGVFTRPAGCHANKIGQIFDEPRCVRPGKFFIDPGAQVYEGQVIGEHSRSGDLVINITKTKKLTNMRASGSDEKMRIAPAVRFSLEEALEYIQSDEYVEVTPKSIRVRKVYLNETDRKRERNKVLVS